MSHVEISEQRYDLAGNLAAFEAGELDDEDTEFLFQYLVDTGVIVQLQGAYQRMAMALINSGVISPAEWMLH